MKKIHIEIIVDAEKKPFIQYSIDYGWVYLLYSYATDAARQTSTLRTLISTK